MTVPPQFRNFTIGIPPEVKRVLLARPHPFIVRTEEEILTGLGYVVRTTANSDELPRLAAGALRGATISNAIDSPVREPLGAVFRLLRQHRPSLPVVFTSVFDHATTLGSVRAALGADAAGCDFLSPRPESIGHPGLGGGRALVILTKEDLLQPARLAVTRDLLLRHFR